MYSERTRAIEIGKPIDLRFKLFDPVGFREAGYLALGLALVMLCMAILRGMTLLERVVTGLVLAAPLVIMAFVKFRDLPFESWLAGKWRYLGMRKRYRFLSVFDDGVLPVEATPVEAHAPLPQADADTPAPESEAATPAQPSEAEPALDAQPGPAPVRSRWSSWPRLPTLPGLPKLSWPRLAKRSQPHSETHWPAHRVRPVWPTDSRVGDPALVCGVFVLLLVTAGALALLREAPAFAALQ